MLSINCQKTERNLYSPRYTKPYVLNKLLSKNTSILHICNSEKSALELYNCAKFFISNNVKLIYLPASDSNPYSSDNYTNFAHRASELYKLSISINSKRLVISSIAGLIQYQPPIDIIKGMSKNLQIREQYNFLELVKLLYNIGYKRVNIVEEFGEFSVHEGIIDISRFGDDYGIRLNFISNNLNTIENFDLNTQASIKKVKCTTIIPAHEVFLSNSLKNSFLLHCSKKLDISTIEYLHNINDIKLREEISWLQSMYYKNPSSIFDYVTKDTIIVQEHNIGPYIKEYWQLLDKKYRAKIVNNNLLYSLHSPLNIYLSPANISKKISSFSNFTLTQLSNNKEDKFEQINNIYYSSRLDNTLELEGLKKLLFSQDSIFKNKKIILLLSSESKLDRIKNYLSQQGYNFYIITNIDETKTSKRRLFLSKLSFETGFISDDLVFITEKDISGKVTVCSRAKKNYNKKFLQNSYSLYPGELVVHKKFGIGKYEGIKEIKASNNIKDFIQMTYHNNDRLFVPVEDFSLITKYGNNSISKLDQLGKNSWTLRKRKVKNKIEKIAKKLIDIAAQRKLQKGIKLTPIYTSYKKFCNSFEHIETNDQMSAIEDIIKDFSSGSITDRLVCGDVGFGKTEIAMRAAFIAVKGDNPAQVAILAPTTLLVEQHYRTFLSRFIGFDITIKAISRNNTKKENDKIKSDLKSGKIDIIIGTHSLLINSIFFKNLALVIIDEEQNFGVVQKEKLKQSKKNVHMLTLSATPIPRTLQMSLVGIRDLSIISTPPISRKSIKTYVLPFSLDVLKQAISRENGRGGIVLITTPRIQYIDDIKKLIQKHFSHLTSRTIHGRLDSKYIKKTLLELRKNSIDILISTQIIESGLDIENANTIIIDKSNMFGLSQLYQIRGRVGRRKQQAYTYLTYDPKNKFEPEIHERLSIIKSLDQPGSSLRLATADMDMRGYGNLIGDKQSGNVKDIGIELYQQMLFDTITMSEEEGERKDDYFEDQEINPKIITKDIILIPKYYISNETLRCMMYRKIMSLDTLEEFDKLMDELIDRFGALPHEVKNLIDVARIKLFAKKCLVEKVEIYKERSIIKFSKINTKPAQFFKDFEILNNLLKYKSTKVTCNDGDVKLM